MAATQTLQTEKFPSQVSDQKPSIPVVTHVITDEDIGALQVTAFFHFDEAHCRSAHG